MRGAELWRDRPQYHALYASQRSKPRWLTIPTPYRSMGAGIFPKQISVGANTVDWVESAVFCLDGRPDCIQLPPPCGDLHTNRTPLRQGTIGCCALFLVPEIVLGVKSFRALPSVGWTRPHQRHSLCCRISDMICEISHVESSRSI